jgi:colicin import membrane protein
MSQVLREHSWPLLGSVLLHGALVVALILVAKISFDRPAVVPMGPSVNAVAVDSQVLKAAQQRKQDSMQRKAAAEARAREEAEQRRIAQEQEQERAEQAKAEAARAEAAKAVAAQRVAELEATQKAAALAAKSAAAKTAALQAAAAKAAAQRAQADKAAAAKAQTAKAAVEREQQEQAAAAADQKARAAREAELRRQVAEEERLSALQSGPQQASYIASLQNKITRSWLKPASARPGIVCKIEVTQVAGGEVIKAHVTDCNGDEAVRQSIENAVYRASPLPQPSDPALFQRFLTLVFKPNE